MSDNLTIAERVANGVALLDKKRPGWDRQINLKTLQMDNACLCIVGQVFGNYWDVLETPEVLGLKESGDGRWAATSHLGFDAEGIGRYEWEALEAEWKRVITERRSAGAR